MAAPFAQLQQRVNDADISHLSNRSFLINGSYVDGAFDNEFIDVGMVESQAPVFECREIDIGIVTQGMTVTSGDDAYKVRGIRPDGTGLVKLVLEKQ
ncbi:hypothetical protein W03_09960 [Nitrosomonas sp. PY1]|uniref:head-tail joining protein n=1 Tax=Nitrosomonas sp. PY1 TaxID=1803906 RepID=UPI001FC8556D|nr:hypothetical protein [Nitrosomonas sp. PY1]GKS68992.1 hypothetical protein W03_09960 [Nitrosomonas sp. PY1]